ncbi:uncharacterized protein LOC18437674 [Amborella trichopoda]|uniref:uncharacterized protein LOC18437674 n=1 Tax=Amborella trichopoda TaxID=13333 RepID=UPI0005D3A833|nr:uncharacterized protein LOC18437674 [Amborella trichopoda]|eukprot:XP_011624676.1 uncharacterized protein LOC18437674 [Amborella trichopoda]
MAANSNMGVHHSMFNRHAISFGSGAINSSASMSSESSPGLKHDTGLAVEWSIEEQSILEEGLGRLSEESNIMRYIKIAAQLPDKTVRDVALRCRWMTKKENGKRRKPEDTYTGKKLKERKEKMVDSSLRTSIPPVLPYNISPYAYTFQNVDNNKVQSCEVPIISDTTRHLLEENVRVLHQISSNLANYKIQDNIELFCRTRDNIAAILSDMRTMPGIMSQMPPLTFGINEQLASALLPNTSQLHLQALMFGNPGLRLKQEPR